MTQNEKDAKASTTKDEAAEAKRELTDQEIASVAGGSGASGAHHPATNTVPGKPPGPLSGA